MLHKIFFLLVLILISSLSILCASDSDKITIIKTTVCANQELQLNGFGTRKKFFIKLYVAALYTQEKIEDANQILEMTHASCMRLHISSSKITSEKMIKATKEGFEKSTQGNIAPIESEIETFLAWFEQPIKKGDLFEFAFIPHNAIHISKNSDELGVIENKEFASALFGIWLGKMPVQQDLKLKLLENQ